MATIALRRADLVKLRRGSRGSATRCATKLNDIADDITLPRPRKIFQLKAKLADLIANIEKLEDLDQQIVTLTEDAELDDEVRAASDANEVHRNARDEIAYRIALLEAEEALATANAATTNNTPPIVNNTPSTRVSNRPKLLLPRFNGEILQWQAFWQAFEAEIDSDATIANINKFNYLMGQLEPSVAATVAGLPPSNASYPELVRLLQERYGSTSKITMAYMRALYSLPKPDHAMSSLSTFYDSIEAYVRGLEALGKTTDSYGDLLVCILLDKLPGDLRKILARQHDQDEWSLDELRKAIRSEIRVLEAGQSVNFRPQQQNKKFTTSLLHSVSGAASGSCHFCSGDHYPNKCNKHSTAEDRWKIVKQKLLCSNCLHDGHKFSDCRSRFSCHLCKGRHHTSLHDDRKVTKAAATPPTPVQSTSVIVQPSSAIATETSASQPVTSLIGTSVSVSSVPVTTLQSSVTSTPYVFLKTAIVVARSRRGVVKANVLLDEGSQRTFMTRRFASFLKIKSITQERLILSGFSAISQNTNIYDVAEIIFVDRDNDQIIVNAIIVDQIARPLDDQYRDKLHDLSHLRGLDLAHPNTGQKSFYVDVLIGADFYWSFVNDETPIRGIGPTAIKSWVGYLVSGPLADVQVDTRSVTASFHITAEEDDITRLWSLESMGIFPHQEVNDSVLDYAATSIEFQGGSYVARFPWKADHPELPSNRNLVRKTTRSTILRLARDPALFQLFGELIKQQLSLQYIEEVPQSELYKRCHYIPYHYVKKDSVTTPIRIVYNCSCRGWNGVSFNDCVETGAALHKDQTQILLRFRTHAVGFTADVEKAFHHIKLHPKDKDFLRWLWLKDPSDPNSEFKVYRFNVIPFGAKSSPFILNSTVIHHLSTYQSSAVARDMLQNFYVDNLISGAESTSEVIDYYKTANDIMDRANLPLQTWGFSEPSVEQLLQSESRLDKSNFSKTLGLIWNRVDDTLSVQRVDLSKFCLTSATFRDVLRGVAKVYDPFGFYSPLLTRGKILLQDLNKLNSSLDQELSDEHNTCWQEIVSSITTAIDNQIMKVPRAYFASIKNVRRLHVFSDASRRAYGAVAYFVFEEKVAFVMAKSKINPKKEDHMEGERELSIPEAELMAAWLGTMLSEIIIKALEPLDIKLEIFHWCDSQIVHYWLKKQENHPRQFVTNRVRKIQDYNRVRGVSWMYVQSDHNPADILSRGVDVKQFQSSALWSSGPNWLAFQHLWPSWSANEKMTTHLLVTTVHKPKDPSSLSTVADILTVINVGKYSWRILLRVTALVFRLLDNFKLKDRTRTTWNRLPLSVAELQKAEVVCLRVFQHTHFAEEIKYLQSKSKVHRPPLVAHLDLFVDTNNVVRCGGRFEKANLTRDAMFPVLLPKHSKLTELIIVATHERSFHSGVDTTIAQLQQKYWIPAYRQQVAAIIKKCARCRRISGPAYSLPDPAPLPAGRVQSVYPFSTTGVDYTGAVNIWAEGAEAPTSVYILLFTCGFSRALHLEVVPDLTTESFIRAFRRFTGHHPLPQLIISDNATTFISAGTYIKNLFRDPMVAEFLADRRIRWLYIPKRAPWYGGFWERLIGMAKTVLHKMLGRSKVSLEVLQTAVCEVEALLNDRKLTRLPTSLRDIGPLTPSHLLYGQRLTTLPCSDFMEEELIDPSYGLATSALSLSKAYVKSQNIKRTFTRMWNKVYLPALREQHQKTHGSIIETIKVGDVVQVHDDCKRDHWKLAVVENLIRSEDGKVRVADIRTANGKTNRPINKLYPIEVIDTTDAVASGPAIPVLPESSTARPNRRAANEARKRINQLYQDINSEEE